VGKYARILLVGLLPKPTASVSTQGIPFGPVQHLKALTLSVSAIIDYPFQSSDASNGPLSIDMATLRDCYGTGLAASASIVLERLLFVSLLSPSCKHSS